ncbi:DUF411 domain-containing protein [Sandarakinorhabdus sp.]|uniref:DUF411 domain-containing protein n=1 Tax=Sandarakinorhabdus sp. TaxID=1916663 RepID=UPI00286E7277|nr:DUF411 domain-containing protein [Sandarakinorhabdus sp.]
MRNYLLAIALFSAPAMAAGDIVMHRDPGCGCCEAWAAAVAKQFGQAVRIIDDANRASLHKRLGMQPALASCHTAIIAGMAFEGHVPIADMKRVLAKRPAGVTGLAVPGMPIGSLGMEVPGRAAGPYTVVAFGAGKSSAFAQH